MHKKDFKSGKGVLFLQFLFSEMQVSSFEWFWSVWKITKAYCMYHGSSVTKEQL